MTILHLTVALLLIFGIGIEVLSCLGLLVLRGAFDRLHFLGPASTLGPVAIGAAILLDSRQFADIVKVLLIVAVLLLANPLLTHATARAAYRRHKEASR